MNGKQIQSFITTAHHQADGVAYRQQSNASRGRGSRPWSLKRLGVVAGNTMAALMCLAFMATAPASAQSKGYPERSVDVIVPYSAGTGIDVATRVLSDKLQRAMGEPFVVLNKVGVGGNLGSEFVARAKPDGYTLLVVANTLAMNPSLFKNLHYDPVKDFAPVGLLFKGSMVLVMNSKIKADTLEEFLALAKAEPGRLNYASPGVGTPQHLAMELFKETADVDIMHIPHKGQADAVTAIIGDYVDAGFVPLQTALPHIKSGKMRALAISNPERNEALPDVPTVTEALNKAFDVDLWYGLFAPAGTPEDVVKQLHEQVAVGLADADVQEKLAAQGLSSALSSPSELQDLVKSDMKRWAELIKVRGIEPK